MTTEALAQAAEEGREAAKLGRSFPEACPYATDIGQDDFNTTKRPLMNAWFSAWKKASQQ